MRAPIILTPIHPNVGLQTAYRRQLDRLIDEMHKSIAYWLSVAYKANLPETHRIALDASPAKALQEIVRRLTKRWQRRFNEAAPTLAEYYATAMSKRVDGTLQSILKQAGISVSFKMTAAANDVMQATIGEQVGLIRSIAQQHLGEVQGLVMRSVSTGRDLASLSTQLRARYRVTKRRAALIARDQNNKATATMLRVRQDGLGIEEAIWMHSHAGKEPRPSHVAMNGKRYSVVEGMFDPAIQKYIWPGTEINCRCSSKSIIPGF